MYSTDITVEGRRKHIVFTGFVDGGSYFTTSDERVIEAMEKRSDFGSTFFLYRDTRNEDIPAPDPIKEKKTAVEDVITITDAREHLKKQGVDYRRLKTPEAILRIAGEMNIEFPNLK